MKETRAVVMCVMLVALHVASAHEWEDQLVQDTVDLSNAHSQDQDEAAKDMESLLHWAIEHSDADALRQKAEEVRRQEVIQDYHERKKRVKELSDIISQQPTETQLMQDKIAALTDAASSVEDKVAALADLQELVEPIDNANDLRVLGALEPLVTLLGPDHPPELQAGAAHVLGTAASNNEKLAAELVRDHPQLLQLLLQLAAAHAHAEAANKAMYALARLVAGPASSARSQFYNMGGMTRLQSLMAASAGASQRVKTRAVNLITDLIELTATGDDTSLETWNDAALEAFAAASLDLLQQSEALDVKEKALHAMRTLLLRRGPAGGAALAQQGAEAVLREELTGMDLLSGELADKAEAAAAATVAAGAGSGNDGASGSVVEQQAQPGSAEGEEQEMSAAEVAEHQQQYAAYVGHLCADVLHHLAVHHDEL